MSARPSSASALLLLLLSFSTLYSSRATKVFLLDTLNATSELNWRTYSNQNEEDAWLEETMSLENRNHQVYSTCIQEPDHDVENWLLIPAVARGEAQRLHLDFNFTIIRCATVQALRKGGCKETLKLYATQVDSRHELPAQNWHNRTQWTYVDTLVSHSTETAPDIPAEDTKRTYTQTSSYDVSKQFVYFALRNTGACSSILYVKIYYNICPGTTTAGFLRLPRTVASREAHGVVTVSGECAPNSSPVAIAPLLRHRRRTTIVPALTPPTAICKADGSWQVLGPTECACEPGRVATSDGLCTACGPGTYKSAHGPGQCLPCPENSWANVLGSSQCLCLPGFHRSANKEEANQPCKGHLSRIQSEVRTGEEEEEEGRLAGASTGGGQDDSEARWWEQLGSHSTWPWVLVCAMVVLSLCMVLILLSRKRPTSAKKQSSDLDVLENYKPDTISPDYSRSLGGSGGGCVKAIGGCLGGHGQHGNGTGTSTFRKKMYNSPLICTSAGAPVFHYGTQRSAVVVATGSTSYPHQQHNNRCGTPLSLGRQQQRRRSASCRMYVDPTTYEDPTEILAEFTNEIRAQDVEVTRVIGAGEFGEVCCGRLTVEDAYGQKQQQIVAVKTLLAGSGEKSRSDFLLEASIMGQFEHENVIRLLGVVTRTEPIMILTEYMLNGSLDQFLRINRDGTMDIRNLVNMLQGIAAGMQYLNGMGYVHRDLAARNVLVDDRLTCKIADFGLSRGLIQDTDSCEQQYTTRQGGKIPIRWTAPEAILQHKYTPASDVWSFGVVMWEVMSFGERPYWDWTNHRVIQEVTQNGFRLPAPQDTPQRLYEVMMACWHAERQQRPSFADVLQHLANFMSNMDFFYKFV